MVTCARWRRYGYDRVYVTGDDGVRWGFVDLATGAEHLQDPQRAADFQVGVGAWLAAGRPDRLEFSTGARSGPPGTELHDTTASGTAETGTAESGIASPRPDQQRRRHRPSPLQRNRPKRPATKKSAEEREQAEWIDLAGNRPGQGVREMAAAHRAARPIGARLEQILGVTSDEQPSPRATVAERVTARALRPLTHPLRSRLPKLRPNWWIVNSIRTGAGITIDHLLIGPAGVFTIKTKDHRGNNVWVGNKSVIVSGEKVDYTSEALAESHRAEDLLAAAYDGPHVSVWSIISVVGSVVTGRRFTQDGVLVVAAHRLVDQLRQLPQILSPIEIDEIYAIARRSTTWIPAHAAAPEPVAETETAAEPEQPGRPAPAAIRHIPGAGGRRIPAPTKWVDFDSARTDSVRN